DIVRKVICYLRELNAVQERLPGCLIRVEHWWPPEGTILKVNFDASFSTTSMLFCTVIVIRDNLGREVTFEGDSLIVICKACSPLYDVLAIKAYIQDVKAMASSFHRCLFSHISHEGNTIAHLLGMTGLRSGGCSFLRCNTPNPNLLPE
ncbi:hypothetical protein Goarm_013049, partial [Gossypium armourianum]|nr:hypothetical protein [Gossypium armourianum]